MAAGADPEQGPRILLCGNANVDVLMGRLGTWPQSGTEVLLDDYELRVGGALGIMALALHELGARVEYFANVGNDGFADWLEAQLGPAGVTLRRSDVPTALTVGITHDDGQRTFFSYAGHLVHLATGDLEDAVRMARPGDILFLCGYFLLPGLRRDAPQLLRLARERGVLTLLDTGWPPNGWTEEVRAEVLGLLPHLTYFLPNEQELAALTGFTELTGDEETTEALLALHARAPQTVTVAKLGPRGAGVLEGSRLRVYPPAGGVAVIDTVGAGDSFNSGLIAGLQRGLPLSEAITIGSRVAGAAISSSPRRYPSWEEVAPAAPLSPPG